MQMNEQRLVIIETKIAYQEDTIQQLNAVICTQQKQLDQLEYSCKLLIERLKGLTEFSEISDKTLLNEKPPHY